MSNKWLGGLACLAVAWVLPGCGPGKGDVSGVVQYLAKPLAGGTITFYDEHKGAMSSVIKDDGSYSVSGVIAGTAKVAIIMPVPITMPGLPATKSIVIPSKYNDQEISGLTRKIATGRQKHDFNLD